MDTANPQAPASDVEFLEIGAKASLLFLHLVNLEGPFQMPDGTDLEVEQDGDQASMINHSANGHHTYIYSTLNGSISISYADGRNLHELQLKPGKEPQYQNGDTGAEFPKQDFLKFLDTAIEAFAPPR